MKPKERQDHIESIKNWLGVGSINIFGLPFSGKDTQAHSVAKILGTPVIAGGDILRSHPDQEKVSALMATGELFPTDFYLSVILPYLSKAEFVSKPLVLSSVGRWHGEEPVIEEAAQKSGHPIRAVVFLNMPEEEVRRRYSASQQVHDRGNRLDDVEYLIDVRLGEFRSKTLPVINYYRQKGLLIEVDGSKSKKDVTDLIIDELFQTAST